MLKCCIFGAKEDVEEAKNERAKRDQKQKDQKQSNPPSGDVETMERGVARQSHLAETKLVPQLL